MHYVYKNKPNLLGVRADTEPIPQFTPEEIEKIREHTTKVAPLFEAYAKKEAEIDPTLTGDERKRAILRVRQELWGRLAEARKGSGLSEGRLTAYTRQQLVEVFGPRGGDLLKAKTKSETDKWLRERWEQYERSKDNLPQNRFK